MNRCESPIKSYVFDVSLLGFDFCSSLVFSTFSAAHLTIFCTSFLIHFLRGIKRKPLPVPSLKIHFFCLKCESSVFFLRILNRILFIYKVEKFLFILFFYLFFKVLGSLYHQWRALLDVLWQGCWINQFLSKSSTSAF